MAVSIGAVDGAALDRSNPGQFVVVRTPGSTDSPAIVRSYSLTASAELGRYEIAVKCEPQGAMGTFLAERARTGDALEVSAPRGSFVLRESDRPAILVSAGIGITPVLAMLRSLAASRSQRIVWWLYGARNGAEHPFADDVRALLAALSNAHSHVRYSRPGDGDRAGQHFDSVGHVDAALVGQLGIGAESEFYLCGPTAFLQDLKDGLAAMGIPSDRIFSEVFGAGSVLNPGIVGAETAPPRAPAGPPGAGPLVSFSRSGLNVNWSPQYASLLEFAEACKVPTRWSCRVGVCHTCESGLISGEVKYDPEPLQPAAPGNLLLCCSSPSGELVLDL